MAIEGLADKNTSRFLVAAIIFFFLSARAFGASPSLPDRIDGAIDTARPGPAPGRCSDAEFLRRTCLDLVGTIPSTAAARAFLDDSSPSKRTDLVDQLLEDPRFDMNFSRVFDVMLMERRPEKFIKPHLFREFLRQSFEAHKPLDQVVREILIADGADPTTRPSARFLLDREGGTHVLTRDVGRLLLGVDLQCAQCHDHPSIKDYRQDDYHGIYALLNRSFVFNAKGTGNVMAERAEGETTFVSVFIKGEPKKAVPHLPGGPPLAEPILDKDKRYLVKEAEGTRPIPRYSSRRRLAEELTTGQCGAFQRNIANRVWCHMFGRGIVNPLDLHHATNPAGHPELLDLLSEALVEVKFDLRRIVRGIALSRTYQQSSELPPGLEVLGSSAAAELAALEKQLQVIDGETATLQKDRVAQQAQGEELRRNLQREGEKLRALRDHEQTAQGHFEHIEADLKAAIAKEASLSKTVASVAALSGQATRTAEPLPAIDPLHDAAAKIAARAEAFRGDLAALRDEVRGREQSRSEALALLEQAHRAVATAQADELAAQESLAPVTKRIHVLSAKHGDLLRQRAAISGRRDDLRELQAYATAMRQANSNEKSAREQRERLERRWRERGYCAMIRPLTAEQTAWSISQSLGVIDRHREEAATEIEKTMAAEKQQPSGDSTVRRRRVEAAVDAKVFGSLFDFVVNIYDRRGQPTGEYCATAGEPLFLGNDRRIQQWIKGGPLSLSERLDKSVDEQALAEDLYLALLTRRPNPEEVATVRDYLTVHAQDRTSAIRDLIAAVLNSAEFRFRY